MGGDAFRSQFFKTFYRVREPKWEKGHSLLRPWPLMVRNVQKLFFTVMCTLSYLVIIFGEILCQMAELLGTGLLVYKGQN